MRVPQLSRCDALTAGTRGILITPPDLSESRFNIGLRALGEGVTMSIAARQHRHRPTDGPPQLHAKHVEISARDLFERAGSNQAMVFAVEQESAFVYGATAGGTFTRTEDQQPGRRRRSAPAQHGRDAVSRRPYVRLGISSLQGSRPVDVEREVVADVPARTR